jgi:8-oxo-dGTP pyrophosphatase MutT (NUDIX family)
VTGYCPRCGTGLAGPPPTTCAACGYQLFVNARPTATVVIVRDGRYLAMRRVHEPCSGQWDLPGGFCDGFEHPADAAVREAREELGVTVVLGELIGTYIGRYDFQGETLPVLEFFYFAEIVGGQLRLDPAEGSELAWLPLADPPPMAFPSMNRMLLDAGRLLAPTS